MSGHGYDKTIKVMMHDFVKGKLKPDQVVTSKQIVEWFRQNYPNVKSSSVRAHLISMTTNAKSRIHHNVKPGSGHDLFFQIDSSTFRMYDQEKDPAPFYKKNDIDQNNIEEDEDNDLEYSLEKFREFTYEKDLRNFLVKNLDLIEPGLHLYENEGITGIEYPVGNRFVDILSVDKDNSLIVIELKVSKGYERVIGQILRYLAWIEKNLAEENQKVRGIIIARKITEDLILACSKIPDVELMEYELAVSIKKLKSN